MLLLDVNFAQAVTSWRSVARGARANLAHQKYGAAEQGYAQALDMLSNQNPKAEEIFDLKLLLVETYRRDGQYGKADAILHSLEPAIARNNFADPTIAVRFWRRRAELRCSQKRFVEGIACMKKAISILEKYFQSSSATLLNNYTVLLRLACEQHDWSTIAEVLDKIHSDNRKPETTPGASELHQIAALKEARAIAFNLVCDRASKLVAAQDYKGAMILFRLMENDGHGEIGVQLLLSALMTNTRDKNFEKADVIVPFLNSALDKLSESDKQSLALKIAGHAELACMYEIRGNAEKQLSEWKKVLELYNKQKSGHSFIDEYHACHARNRISTLSEFKPEGASDRAIELISQSINATKLPASMHLSAPDLRAMRVMHVDSRVCFSWAYQTRKDWKNSETSLDSIDKQAYGQQPDLMKLTVIGQRIGVAAAYYKQGNFAGCRRNLAIANAQLDPIPDSPERKHMVDWARRVSSGADFNSLSREGGTSQK